MTRTSKHPLRRLPLLITLCSVLGVAGAVSGFSGLASWREPVPELPGINLPKAPEGEEEAWAKVQAAISELPERYGEVLRERRAATTALAGTNLIASAVLLFGAFAARARRPWAPKSLRTGLSLSQAYAVLALVVQGWIQIDLFNHARELFQPLAAAGGLEATMATSLIVAQIGTVALTAFWAAGQLAFYVWTAAVLRRPGALELITPPKE